MRKYISILILVVSLAGIAAIIVSAYLFPFYVLKGEMEELSQEVKELIKRIDRQEQFLKELKTIKATITAYSPTVDQCDDTPLITASNTRVREGIVALSRDLEKEYNLKFGDVVYIRGLGPFEFQDRMNKRWKKKVDVFFWDREKALEFGKQQREIQLIRVVSSEDA